MFKNLRIHYIRLPGFDTSKYKKNKFEVKREDAQPQVQSDGIKNNIFSGYNRDFYINSKIKKEVSIVNM